MPFVGIVRTRQFAARAQELLKSETFDYCQAHDSFALLAAHRISKRTGAKVIYDAVEVPKERSGLATSGTPRFIRDFEMHRDRQFIQGAAQVLTVGDALAEWTASTYKIPPPTVVRNCSLFIEQTKDCQIRRDLNVRPHERIALLLGSIYQDQGVEQLIASVPKLNPAVHVVILGPVTQARYHEVISERIARANLDSRVHLLPPKPQQEVISYASGADVGIIALQQTRLNHRLALPNKLFEYLMARLPVAVGRLPNVCAIVEKYGIGRVFDETNPDDIAYSIEEILSEDTYRSLKRATHRAARELSWENESEKYLDLFA